MLLNDRNKVPYILIADDVRVNLDLLKIILLQQGYEVQTSDNGNSLLEEARLRTPDLILLDIKMPGMDGFEVCTYLKNDPDLQEIPVIFISAVDELQEKIHGFQVGGVDYITKPFKKEEVLARISTHLRIRKLQQELEIHNHHLKEIIDEKVEEINESQLAMILAMIKLTEARDDDTGKHIERIRTFSKVLAEYLFNRGIYLEEVNPAFIENIYNASSLHDIGKVAIPDQILLKPGRLTPEEFEIMKTHTTLGANTLEVVKEKCVHIPYLNMGIEISRSHHEKWDGSGYPQGLKEEQIPLSARIMAISDVYDALRSKRVYKDSFSHEKSRDIILEGKGKHFDPVLVDAFIDMEQEFMTIRDEMSD